MGQLFFSDNNTHSSIRCQTYFIFRLLRFLEKINVRKLCILNLPAGFFIDVFHGSNFNLHNTYNVIANVEKPLSCNYVFRTPFRDLETKI